MTDLLTIGEALLSLRHEDPGPLRLGGQLRASVAGAEATVAIGAARLGHAAAWCGRIGNDDTGDLILSTLRGAGVDTSAAVTDPEAATGLLIRVARTAALTRVTYHRSGSAGSRLTPADVTPALANRPRVVHTSGITLALGDSPRQACRQALRQAKMQQATISYDVNHRARLCSVDEAAHHLAAVLPLVDIFFCGDDELDVVRAATGKPHDPIAALHTAGVREVVVKHGSRGATVHTPDGTADTPALPVPAVDAVGAGDAFAAGYLSALLDGLGLDQRLHRASATGAFCVASHGDWEGLPTRAELPLLTLQPDTTLR
ncbi:sugar kinase [Streptomyces sp. KR80]|uniref:sugar kinase n=1 Tax=Streptomyces sp. KR80 TaxID=3457426 RepID=UPI003FD1ADCD